MKPPKPYSPFKRCKKCKTDYRHYNLSTTPCPRCEELKNELKGNVQRTSYDPKTITSIRAGRNLRKLTSEQGEDLSRGKDRNTFKSKQGANGVSGTVQGGSEDWKANERKYARGVYPKTISKVSKKQARINATLAKIKAQMVNDNDSQCFTCGYVGDVDLSHLIPRSKRSDLITDKGNMILQCRRCHTNFEALNVFEIRKFRNLNKILDYIESVDSARFIHVTSKLSEQLNYSR